ncbi:MAG: hypothetical protein ABI120_21875 [Gemmatimonadaceae bacterium]
MKTLSRLSAGAALALGALILHPERIAAQATVSLPVPPATADSTASNPRAVQPEHQTVATHAGNVAPGYVEIESGIERDCVSADARATQVPTVIKIGIAQRAQLSIGVPLNGATGSALGLGDVSVVVKWRVLDHAPIVRDFAVQPALKFNTGGTRGTGTTDASVLLISSRSLGAVDVDVNAGVTRRSGDGTLAPRTATLWAAAAATMVHGALSFAFELCGYPGTSGVAGSAPIVAVLLGPTYPVRPELNLDIGIIEPIAGAQSRAIYAGVVANVGGLPFVKRTR